MRIKSLALFIAAAFGTTAFAAHQYDTSKTQSLTGTVTKVEWNNKDYVKIHMDAPGKNGKKADWELQTTSRDKLQADGITMSNLKDGDQITVQGHPASSGSAHLLATSFTLANGQTIALNGQPSQQPVESAQNTPPPPPAPSAENNAPAPQSDIAQNNPPANSDQQSLPSTASNMPLIGLIGLLALGAGGVLTLARRLS